MEEIESIKERCERETAANKRLDDKLKATQTDIIQLKRKQSGTSSNALNTEEKASQMSKQIKILENRLDQATKKYSETQSKNKETRGHIDQLRRERLVYEQAYTCLEKKLGVKRTEITKMVAQVAEVNQDRDRAILKIKALQDQAKAMQSMQSDMKVEEIGPDYGGEHDKAEAKEAAPKPKENLSQLQRLENALQGKHG